MQIISTRGGSQCSTSDWDSSKIINTTTNPRQFTLVFPFDSSAQLPIYLPFSLMCTCFSARITHYHHQCFLQPDLVTATLHLDHGLHTFLFCLREIFSTEPPLSRSSPVDTAGSSHQATGRTSLWSGDEIRRFVWSHGEGSERVPGPRMTGNGTENGGFAARYILVSSNLHN